jgi:hypothetical protein
MEKAQVQISPVYVTQRCIVIEGRTICAAFQVNEPSKPTSLVFLIGSAAENDDALLYEFSQPSLS